MVYIERINGYIADVPNIDFYSSSDNRRTYNQQSSVTLSGNKFYVRDEQDIRSLAIEIASLTKRQQRGRGLRMA